MAVRRMTELTLNALKGWPEDHALDYLAPLEPTLPSNELPVPPGTVVHLNAAGKYTLGVGTLKVMPLFLFTDSQDSTSYYDGGNPATSKHASVPMLGGTAPLMALVATGSLELVSTAYVTGQSYPPNTPLTAALSGAANAGRLKPGVIGTDMIVGLVSQGVVDNGYGKMGLAFWCVPVFPQ